jgi:three-Cys-motif partner protein
MTTDTAKFFKARQDAAFVKHTILGDYLVPYVTKAGSRTRRVVYVDGYAGPGVYEDETPGSPAIAMETAQKLKSTRQFRGHFIEQDPNFAAELQRFVRDQGVEDDWVVHHGSAEDCLPMALDDARRDPLLLFLDPYGLTVPFDQLVGEVMSRTGTCQAW